MSIICRRLLPICLVLCAGVLTTGCADEYSKSVRYRGRIDPVFKVTPDQLIPDTEQQPFPDAPNELPLMTTNGMDRPLNPYSHLSEEIEKKVAANTYDPRQMSVEDKQKFREGMSMLFGTPRQPKIGVENRDALKDLNLEADVLARGSSLYRVQCLTCHGLAGDGRGPTAPWVNPHPRDYRQGKFKFQSVDQASGVIYPPLREDLMRTLRQGVESTSMPAFNLLPEKDLEALTSFVIYLAIRGQTELETIKAGLKSDTDGKLVFDRKKLDDGNIHATINTNAGIFLSIWSSAQDKGIKISKDSEYPFDRKNFKTEKAHQDAMAASVVRGYAMFVADAKKYQKALPEKDFAAKYPNLFPKTDGKVDEKKSHEAIAKLVNSVKCVQCHVDFGRRAQYKFDEWGTLTKARNLYNGNFRGGRRPIDIYWRIHSGINGSGMKSFGKDLKSEQIWDMVNFIRALPYPAMREAYGLKID